MYNGVQAVAAEGGGVIPLSCVFIEVEKRYIMKAITSIICTRYGTLVLRQQSVPGAKICGLRHT